MLLVMMDLEKMKITENLKRENIGRTTLKKIKDRNENGVRMLLPLKKATLRKIRHTKIRRENVLRVDMDLTLARRRSSLRKRRRKGRTTPIPKVLPKMTQAGRKEGRRKRKKVTFHRMTPTRKLIIGRIRPSL